MPDSELIQFAINESKSLTPESFHLLVKEFENRNLDIGILEEVEVDRVLFEIGKQNKIEENLTNDYENSLIVFVIEEKKNGKENSEIFKKLLTKGVDEQIASMLIVTLPFKIKVIINHLHTNMLMSGIFLGIGLIVCFLWINKILGEMSILVGLLFSIAGFIALIKSRIESEKYKSVLHNLEKEEEKNNEIHSQSQNPHLN